MELTQLQNIGLNAVKEENKNIDEIEYFNTKKILKAFQEEKVNYNDFQSTSGYGYGDAGRDKLERIYAGVFHGEDALVRQQIVSGTHAITLALFAMVMPGDHILFYGPPYDTLMKVIGTDKKEPCSLTETGVSYDICQFGDFKSIKGLILRNTRVFYIQRSRGYSNRGALSINDIENLVNIVKSIKKDIIIFVDNCYGEFCEIREPLEVGADLIAGSLIKNPGGAIAPSGGYLCGKKELIERASYRLTAPGIGKEIGSTLMKNTPLYQGFFNAPHVVAECLRSVTYIGAIMRELGYKVIPEANELKSDIVASIFLNNPELLKEFCREIQHYSPVDSHVTPEPWDMPGYEHQVIMAAGGFTEGSSIELSADGPMREPFIAFLQGAPYFTYFRVAIDNVIEKVFLNKN